MLPEEVESIAIREGAEIVTLLTCTPYGINSHRLLVTGKRIPYQAAMSQEIKQAGNYHRKRLIGLLVGLAIFLAIFAYWLSRKIKKYRLHQKNPAINQQDSERVNDKKRASI